MVNISDKHLGLERTNQMIECPSCGKKSPGRAKFCGYCGQEFPQLTHAQSKDAKDTQETDNVSYTNAESNLPKNTYLVVEEIDDSEDSSPDLWTKAAIILGVLCVIAVTLLLLTQTGFSGLGFSYVSPSPSPISSPFSSQTKPPTPLPSVTPMALASPTEMIIPTILPTRIPLNIRRQDVQTIFTNLGFDFHEALAEDHLPRWLGKSIDGFVEIELLGPSHALDKITIFAVDSRVGHQDTVNYSYIESCIRLLAPNWKEGSDWLAKSLYKFDNTPEEREMTISMTYEDLTFLLKNDKRNGLTIFVVEKTQ